MFHQEPTYSRLDQSHQDKFLKPVVYRRRLVSFVSIVVYVLKPFQNHRVDTKSVPFIAFRLVTVRRWLQFPKRPLYILVLDWEVTCTGTAEKEAKTGDLHAKTCAGTHL